MCLCREARGQHSLKKSMKLHREQELILYKLAIFFSMFDYKTYRKFALRKKNREILKIYGCLMVCVVAVPLTGWPKQDQKN